MTKINTLLETINKSYIKDSDSVHDFIHGQLEVSTEEPATLEKARRHYEVLIDNLGEIQSEFEVILKHFTDQ